MESSEECGGMVPMNNRGMHGSSSHHQHQRSYGTSEMAVDKGGGASVSSAAELMNNSSSKGLPGYRWNGDAMMLGRRRVGLSNGGSVSDVSSEEEEEEDEEEEEVEEDAVEEMSDDGEELGAEDEEERDAGVIDRGGSSRGRDRDREREMVHERVGFDDVGTGTEDEGSDEPDLPDFPSPQPKMRVSEGREMVRGDTKGVKVSASRERIRELTSPDEARESSYRQRMREVSSPEEDEHEHEATDDSDSERAVPMSRLPERNQVSACEASRDLIGRSGKGPRGMIDTTKRKSDSAHVNGESKKVEKEPSTNVSGRRRSTGNGERRFNSDNKARVTLERAREILAAVKASMMNDPKQFVMRHTDSRVVDNSSSSGDEKHSLQFPPPRALPPAQVRLEDKLMKKRSRAPKGDKGVPARRRKPKVEVDFHASEEKIFYQRSQAEGLGHERAFKLGHFSSSGVEVTREGRITHDVDGDVHFERKESREEVFEPQIATVEKKARKRRKTKDGDDAAPTSTGLCPGSSMRNENWEPPASPFGLIQESLYKDPWKVLLSCMLLNKTAGRQMHKVIWDLFSLCPDAESAINTDTAKIAEKVYSLGLQNKRAKMIQRFSLEYLRGDWTNVTQLHGIGKYAADAYAIFCQGLWRDVEPDDLQLVKYWKWLWETDGQGNGFTPDNNS